MRQQAYADLYPRPLPSVQLVDDAKWEPIPEQFVWRENNGNHIYTDPLDLLTPAEAADLPDLDFPVPDQDVIPEMVFESEDPAEMQSSRGSEGTKVHRDSTSSTASRDTLQASPVVVSSCVESMEASIKREIDEQQLAEDVELIPIQSSIVAHARMGRASAAAIQERRAKNTESARRSRARRADKLTLIREHNQQLLAQNAELISENQRLKQLVESLESRLFIKTELD